MKTIDEMKKAASEFFVANGMEQLHFWANEDRDCYIKPGKAEVTARQQYNTFMNKMVMTKDFTGLEIAEIGRAHV